MDPASFNQLTREDQLLLLVQAPVVKDDRSDRTTYLFDGWYVEVTFDEAPLRVERVFAYPSGPLPR